MTTRLAMAVALLLVLLAQAWGLVSVWRDDPLRDLAPTEKKEAGAPVLSRAVSMQPSLGVVPDFNQGYLFNAERGLAAGSGRGGQAQNAANVGIDKIQYSGSIITATNPKALLSYSLGGPAVPSDGGVGAGKQGFLRVAIGDMVNGYKVTEILPEKIIFSRDGQQITKFLYDKGKERGQGATSLPSRIPTGKIPAAVPVIPDTKAVEPPRLPTPRKQLQPPPPPSDEELRKNPLRKRPEPPPV
ncbi:MAG: hypothetical protein KKH22_12115 [Proteobacteria bacterium]|nr:hypothetical protein [Pseudomonadota bacterium]